jgi:hypothetical protein
VEGQRKQGRGGSRHLARRSVRSSTSAGRIGPAGAIYLAMAQREMARVLEQTAKLFAQLFQLPGRARLPESFPRLLEQFLLAGKEPSPGAQFFRLLHGLALPTEASRRRGKVVDLAEAILNGLDSRVQFGAEPSTTAIKGVVIGRSPFTYFIFTRLRKPLSSVGSAIRHIPATIPRRATLPVQAISSHTRTIGGSIERSLLRVLCVEKMRGAVSECLGPPVSRSEHAQRNGASP